MIDQNQQQLGVISLNDALDLAREAGLDLVEVSPTEKPPVCRIMDYGKFKYDRKKRQKQAAGAHVTVLKEIRIRPKTDTNDRQIKLKHAREFLGEGHKVQFTMLFRGRERFHKERAVDIFDSILVEFGESVKVERRPVMEGRRMTMVIAPVKASSQSDSSAPKPPKQEPKQEPTPEQKANECPTGN